MGTEKKKEKDDFKMPAILSAMTVWCWNIWQHPESIFMIYRQSQKSLELMGVLITLDGNKS